MKNRTHRKQTHSQQVDDLGSNPLKDQVFSMTIRNFTEKYQPDQPIPSTKKVLFPIIGTNLVLNNDSENVESYNVLANDNSKGTLLNTNL